MRPNVLTSRLAVATAAMATMVFLAGPAFAGQRGSSHQGGGGGRPAAHASAPRAMAAPRMAAPRAMSSPQRLYAPSPVYRQAAPLQQRGGAVPRFESGSGSRVVLPSREYPVGRTPIGVAVPRPIHPVTTIGVGRPIFSSPYYNFRSHFNLGFGLYAGYPVAFPLGYSPYDYGYGYGYGYDPYAYGYYGDVEPYGYAPAYPAPTPDYSTEASSVGGLSFDIQPVDAAVFIDNKYVGTVADFNPQAPPLTLAAGKHHVDLRAQGYQTMSFDITVVPGQVIPYQGAMSVIR